ncbi:putative fructose-bisphosphate aldolase [Colletotrichum shisoi]|uniref:Fructose-bisphosphate aldolase n=1 Tax=Colletotrichum shisoi TaxID=2078593 RepID=A0A5Q4BHA0_9PEZI|nr:putative fructose-bisphosphate aldolase [Colletotrichum shisoi]
MSVWSDKKSQNRTLRILQAATEGIYGVLAAVAYNVEHLTALQLPTLPWAVAAAVQSATVPLALQLDHAQDEAQIRDMAAALPFDSIMVDMSHHDHAENLARTKVLARVLPRPRHRRRGRERDASTAARTASRTRGTWRLCSPAARRSRTSSRPRSTSWRPASATSTATTAPRAAGPEGLDYERLARVNAQIGGRRVLMALHGANGFSAEILQRCIRNGAIKLNVNKLLLEVWNAHLQENAARKPLSQLMEDGMNILQEEVERWVDICGSAGKA